jgi:hypothetical protein
MNPGKSELLPPHGVDVGVAVDEVKIDGVRHLQGQVYRRVGKADEWLFDGVECCAAPVISGDVHGAFVHLCWALYQSFAVVVPSSADPSRTTGQVLS